MNSDSVAKLVELREEFARQYQKPLGRFVSMGFSVVGGRPCLNVLVDDRFEMRDLPGHFQGVQVQVRESRPGIFAVGSIEEADAARH